MESKLIFLDIDGTILSRKGYISRRVRDGLYKARKYGHKVFINTGRAFGILPEELSEIEPDGIIASAGSDIWIEEKNIWRAALPENLLEKACRTLRETDVVCLLENFDNTYISERGMQILRNEKPIDNDNSELIRWKKVFGRMKNVKSMREWERNKAPVPKISFIVWDKEQMEHIHTALGEDFDIAEFPSASGKMYNGELISLDINKGTAVRYVAGILGIDIRNTIAFGDSMNDYRMLKQASTGIAMGNAEQRLKEIADRVCESVEEDGVVRELEKMGLI